MIDSLILGFMVLVEKKFHIFFIRHPPKLDNMKHSLPKLEVEDLYLSFLRSYLS